MDLTQPATSLCQPAMAATLEVLAGADAAFTGRQIARMSEVSVQTTLATLHRLVEHGLVYLQIIGRTHQCRLNTDHLAAPAVMVATGMHVELNSRLRKAFSAWDPPPRHASIFGSAARRDGDTRSDLDILLVRSPKVGSANKQWRSQVDALAEQALAWTGNRVSWVELSPRELTEAARKDAAIVDEWRRDGIRLFGLTLGLLLRQLS